MGKQQQLDPHPPSLLRVLAMTFVVAMVLLALVIAFIAGSHTSAPKSELVSTDVTHAVDTGDDGDRYGDGSAEISTAIPPTAPSTANTVTPGHETAADPDINRVVDGMTALMSAASQGDSAAVRDLLNRGADPNTRGSSQRTALQYAAETNRIEVARLLLDAGADVNGYDRARLTPLVMTADRGYTEFAKLLLGAGADANIAHVKGWTALIDAAHNGNRELVELLIKHGANIDTRTPGGHTAIDYAAAAGHREIVRRLAAASRQGR